MLALAASAVVCLPPQNNPATHSLVNTHSVISPATNQLRVIFRACFLHVFKYCHHRVKWMLQSEEVFNLVAKLRAIRAQICQSVITTVTPPMWPPLFEYSSSQTDMRPAYRCSTSLPTEWISRISSLHVFIHFLQNCKCVQSVGLDLRKQVLQGHILLSDLLRRQLAIFTKSKVIVTSLQRDVAPVDVSELVFHPMFSKVFNQNFFPLMIEPKVCWYLICRCLYFRTTSLMTSFYKQPATTGLNELQLERCRLSLQTRPSCPFQLQQVW